MFRLVCFFVISIVVFIGHHLFLNWVNDVDSAKYCAKSMLYDFGWEISTSLESVIGSSYVELLEESVLDDRQIDDVYVFHSVMKSASGDIDHIIRVPHKEFCPAIYGYIEVAVPASSSDNFKAFLSELDLN